MIDIVFIAVLIIIAFLYSSVGHGGASGYLALMAIFAMEPSMMKASALTLNLFVAGTAFIAFARRGYFRWKILLPFVITSMPAAFLGARMYIDPTTYKVILGLVLLIAVFRMLIRFQDKSDGHKQVHFGLAMLLGAGLGFFSGMIGIGGGIILSPLLLIFGWTNVKQAAAASALFIFLNSATGLLGLHSTGFEINQDIVLWVMAGFVGGMLGSYNGSYRFSLATIRYILAGVLAMASFKLFFF